MHPMAGDFFFEEAGYLLEQRKPNLRQQWRKVQNKRNMSDNNLWDLGLWVRAGVGLGQQCLGRVSERAHIRPRFSSANRV